MALLLTASILIGAYVPAASAHGLGQWIWWDDEGETFHEFGANASITINTGKMQIIPYCSEGNPDGLTSWTDLYIVPSGSITDLSDGEELEDVSGGAPNSVMSLSSGIFISETIGYTGPDGKIPPGSYAIVFDECQDGKFNHLVDGVIDPAFEVEYTTGVVPPLDLTKLKEDAEKEAKRWDRYKKYAEELFKFQKWVDAKNPNEKMVDFLMRSGLQDPRDAALLQLANQAKHYEGIAADPPDPDFQHATPLGDRPVFDFQSGDPLDIAMQSVANEAANEQAITRQLWTLLERYQGAQAAGSVNWALTHAKAIDRNLNLLLAQLQRTSQSVSRMNQALAADSRPLTQIAAEMEQLRSRIATSGLTNDEIRYLMGLGFSDAEIAQFKADFVAQDFAFTKNDMLAWGSGLLDDNNIFGPDLVDFSNHVVDVINQLLQDPTVNDDGPVSEAGGPYTAAEGSAITFNGSASSSATGISKYEWDLDGDGNFGDAQGAYVIHSYHMPFNGYIGLKVTDGAGSEAVDYAKVSVTDVNRSPVISASTPVDRHAELHGGESAVFGVTASDPDNDPVSTEWFVDGVTAGTGTTFIYRPAIADTGIHRIEAVVTDGNPLGGSVRTGWTAQVLRPLPASITLAPASKSLRVGTSHSLQATVLDDQGNPVAGLSVSLVITGANANTLTGVTDNSGVAAFSYTGAHTGDDQATAEAALLTSNAASVHWITADTTPPKVFFNPQSSGRNVTLLESGATVVSASGSYNGDHSPQAMLDYSAAPYYPWATAGLTGQYVKVALAGGKTYQIDNVQLMPRVEFDNQRVKDFEILVSTTTTDDSAFTKVLTAQAANNGTLQNFPLPKPVMAKYIMYRPLTRQGTDGCNCISTQQLKVNTGQEGGPTVQFQNLTTTGDGAAIVSWSWNFGDGTTSVEQSPNHTYTAPGNYTVTLTATDSNGQTGSYSLDQTVLAPVAADFTFAPGTPSEGQSVSFTDASVVPNGGRIVLREWNWGDNTAPLQKDGSAASATVSHTFRDNGTYNVKLVILDDRGQTTQIQKTVTVSNLPPNVTDFYKVWVKSAQSAAFDPVISDPGQDILTCHWEFGDGTSSNQCNIAHKYPAVPGGSPDVSYTATLTVTDKDGAVVTKSAEVTVYTPYINPGSAITDSDLYYSRYCTTPNVRKIAFNFDGMNHFTLSAPETVATVGHADGLIFAPDGDLLVGGVTRVYKIDRETGSYVTQPTGGGSALHLMLDKSGKKLWSAGLPGQLVEYPLDPEFGPGKVHAISGDDSAVTSVAFDAQGTAFYTSSGPAGIGSFGIIDMTTFKTTRLLSNVPAAHGMFYDSYTGHLLMVGRNQVLQYDPAALKVVSVFTATTAVVTLDQGGADGKGHILVASNSGHLLFIDYSESKEVGNAHNFVATPYVEACLDDVAPLSGFGAVPPSAINLTPAAAELTVGDTHELQALVTDEKGNMVAGYSVNLTITGANASTLTAVTNASGIARFSYKGNNAGTDTAIARAGSVLSGPATVKWSTPPAAVALTPSSAALKIGETHQLTAFVTDGGGEAKPGLTVKLEITGANPGTLTGTTDSTGAAGFFYRGTNPGDDTIVASVVGTSITSSPATAQWGLSDTAPPVTTAVYAPDSQNGWHNSDITLTLIAADDGSGVKSTEYRKNGGDWSAYSGPIVLTENGTFTYEYRSVDNAGNVENIKSIELKLDKSAPVTLYHLNPIFSTNKSGQQYIKGFVVSLRASDQESGSGVKTTMYRINGSAWIPYNGSFTIYAGVDKVVEYYSIDQAGNIESPVNKMDFVKGVFTGAGKF